jgi:hypothetical protein
MLGLGNTGEKVYGITFYGKLGSKVNMAKLQVVKSYIEKVLK